MPNVTFSKNNPGMGDVHVNQVLSQFSVAYTQQPNNFIADKVFPQVGVSKRSDLYPVWTRKGTNIVAMQKRAPGTAVSMIESNLSTSPYYLDVYALGATLNDQEVDNADDWVDLRLSKTQLLSRQGLILKETLFANGFFKSGVWGTDLTGISDGTPSSTQFKRWDEDLATPKEDIEKAKLTMLEATGYEPNQMVIGVEVWQKLKNHPSIIDLLKYGGQISGNLAVVTLDMVTALFELDRILISKAIYDSEIANPTTENNTFVFGKNCLLFYAPPAPSKFLPSAGYTFYWNKSNYYGSEFGFRMKEYRNETLESLVIENQGAFVQQKICADMGVFFDGAIQ